jgi:hypothetical protein
MERRSDIQFGTLRRVIKALGGSLEIFAVFSDARYRVGPGLVDRSVDAQRHMAGHEHTNVSGREHREALEHDYEAKFGALFACGKLSLARKVGDDICTRRMVLEMAE